MADRTVQEGIALVDLRLYFGQPRIQLVQLLLVRIRYGLQSIDLDAQQGALLIRRLCPRSEARTPIRIVEKRTWWVVGVGGISTVTAERRVVAVFSGHV